MKTRTQSTKKSFVISVALCLFAAMSGSAAVQYFNGTNAVLNWDNGSTPNWSSVSGGPYNVAWANGNDAVFQGTATTVTNLGVSASSLAFTNANWNIISNALTLTGTVPFITNSAAITIKSTIAGTAGFTKRGAGTLTLSGSNIFSGPLTNNAGSAVTAIVVANSNALPATTVCVGAGGGNGNTINVASGITTAPGSTLYLQAAGGTRVALGNSSGNVTWSGDVVATAPDNSVVGIFGNGGTMNILGNIRGSSPVAGLLFRGSTANGNLYGNIWMTNSSIFIVDGSSTSGSWTIYSNSNLWNTAQINGGTLKLGTNDALCTTGSLALGQGNANTFVFEMNGFNQTVSVVTNNNGSTLNRFTNSNLNPSIFTINSTTANSRLAPNGAENIVVGGLISFVKNGSFQFTLGGANTYTGTNTVNGGTLAITNVGTLGNPANPLVLNAGTVNLGGSAQTVGAVTVVNGTITNGTLIATSFDVQAANVSGVLDGSGAALNKTTAGTLTLSAANTFSGPATITGGKVIGVTGGSANSSSFTFAPGAGVTTTNAVKVLSSGGQWSCASLTNTVANGGTIYGEFDYGTVSGPSTSVAPMLVNGDADVNGTLNVIVKGGIGWASGQSYPLLQISGNAPASMTLNLISTPVGVIGGSLSYDPGSKILSYIAGNAPRSLTWIKGSGLWDINATTNWSDASLALTKFQQLDLPTFDDTVGTGSFFVTNNSAVNPSSVTVNNNTANFTLTGSGAITGNGALAKLGTGNLTIASANTYSGGTVVSNGTLVLANSAALGSATLDIEGGALDSGVANLVNANNNPITLGADLIFLGSQNLDLGGSVISFSANRTVAVSNNTLTVSTPVSSSSGITLSKEGAGVLRQGASNALGGESLAVNNGSVDLNGRALTVNAFSGGTNGIIRNNGGSGQVLLTIGSGNGGGTFSGTIADNSTGFGTVALAKVGVGGITLAGSNSYSGPTTISGGCLVNVASANALGATNGEVTETDLNNCVRLTGNLIVTGKTINIQGTGGSPSGGNGNGALEGGAGQTNVWAGTVRLGAGGNPGRVGVLPGVPGVLVISGPMVDGLTASGAGLGLVVNCDTVASSVMLSAPAGLNTYSGQSQIARGTLLLGATNTLPPNDILNVGAAGNFSATFDLNGFDQVVGGLTHSGANTATLQNSSLTSTNTLTINQATDLSYSGNIAGGTAINIVKTGSGQLALLGSNGGYSGNTIVSNGTLLVMTDLGSSAVTVNGGTLGGSGSISAPVNVNSGGTLSPGTNGIGTLTIAGDLTLASGSTTIVKVDQGSAAADQVNGLNTVTYGGTLVVTNLSGTPDTNTTFTLFSASTHVGNFSSIAGSPGTGLAWSFTNGVLSVVAQSYATYPTNITATVSGNTLTLTWPATHLGWILQSQTNALNIGLTPASAWFDVPGSSASNTSVISINPTNPTVFYRLRLP